MNNNEQHRYLNTLNRAEVHKLCIEMKGIIVNLRNHLMECGCTEEEVKVIMIGPTVESFTNVIKDAKKNLKLEIDDEVVDNLEDKQIRQYMKFELDWILEKLAKGERPF